MSTRSPDPVPRVTDQQACATALGREGLSVFEKMSGQRGRADLAKL